MTLIRSVGQKAFPFFLLLVALAFGGRPDA